MSFRLKWKTNINQYTCAHQEIMSLQRPVSYPKIQKNLLRQLLAASKLVVGVGITICQNSPFGIIF